MNATFYVFSIEVSRQIGDFILNKALNILSKYTQQIG